MTIQTLTNQVIALAGIAQASYLVNQIATQGKANQEAMKASIGSILAINSGSIGEIFGGLEGIRLGLEQLQEQLGSNKIHNPDSARYSASIVFLEKQLSNNPQMQDTITRGIQKVQLQAEHFDLLHENILANLGDLYHNTISTLHPRIMVNGEPNYLSNQDNVNKIRSLLLAGIRSALLWRQCGGARWKFLIYRRKLYNETTRLLKYLSD